MDERSQTHATWDCKYHAVFASKGRTKRLYGDVRRELGDLLLGLLCKRVAGLRKDTWCPTMSIC